MERQSNRRRTREAIRLSKEQGVRNGPEWGQHRATIYRTSYQAGSIINIVNIINIITYHRRHCHYHRPHIPSLQPGPQWTPAPPPLPPITLSRLSHHYLTPSSHLQILTSSFDFNPTIITGGNNTNSTQHTLIAVTGQTTHTPSTDSPITIPASCPMTMRFHKRGTPSVPFDSLHLGARTQYSISSHSSAPIPVHPLQSVRLPAHSLG